MWAKTSGQRWRLNNLSSPSDDTVNNLLCLKVIKKKNPFRKAEPGSKNKC